MILDRLEVDHFRIIEQAALELQPGINLFTGPNGAGKTSVLEATHLLARGKSFRRGGVESQIQHGSDTVAVRGRLRGATSSMRLDCLKRRGEPIELRRNRTRIERVSDIVKAVPLQVFLPDLAELIFGAPLARRRWLDFGLLYQSDAALGTMAHYRHVLRQRNAALRRREHNQLDAWDVELAASADALQTLRETCFEAMRSHVESCVNHLCPELDVSLRLFHGYNGTDFASELGAQRQRDVQLRMTNTGPHRADIRVRLGVANAQRSRTATAAARLSQGQARALAAAFKLGQVQYLKELGFESLLLVDDIGSEWDADHCARFLELVKTLGPQALCSAVDTEALPQAWRKRVTQYRLRAGEVTDLAS